jgi:uncharacterized metal-binding protein YceD (DUF177 family)
MTPEFSRTVRIDTLGAAPKPLAIGADETERVALAERFGLAAIDSLAADLTLTRSGETVTAKGTLRAGVTQSCVVTEEPVPAELDEPFTIVFQPQPHAGADDEIELGEDEMDVVFHDGALIDVGEAVAETLSLSLDPYPRAPNAEAALQEAGVKKEEQAEREEAEAKAARSPFAALRKS